MKIKTHPATRAVAALILGFAAANVVTFIFGFIVAAVNSCR